MFMIEINIKIISFADDSVFFCAETAKGVGDVGHRSRPEGPPTLKV